MDINLEAHYRTAKRLVGNLGNDLVHHCYLKMQAVENIQNPDSYLYRIMLNELNRYSEFWKIYGKAESNELTEQAEVLEISPNDSIINILSCMALKGLSAEVKLFMESTHTSISEISKRSNISTETLSKIINFVKAEVKKEYHYEY